MVVTMVTTKCKLHSPSHFYIQPWAGEVYFCNYKLIVRHFGAVALQDRLMRWSP